MNIGEALDEVIAREVMGWCECSLDNHHICHPPYSADRNYAAAVVDEIRLKPEEVIRIFNRLIKEFTTAATERLGQWEPSDYLLFISPDVICNAALDAIRQHKVQAMPVHVDTDHHDT